MSQWQKRIDNLLADLEAETARANDFRANIDRKIWEAEEGASKPVGDEPFSLAEAPVRRRREFIQALRAALIVRRFNEPTDKIWSEALLLLDNPQLRASDHKQSHQK